MLSSFLISTGNGMSWKSSMHICCTKVSSCISTALSTWFFVQHSMLQMLRSFWHIWIYYALWVTLSLELWFSQRLMFLQYTGISSISFIYSSSLMNPLVILLQAHPNKMSLFFTRFAFSKLSWKPQDCICALTLTSLKLKLPPLGLSPLPDPHYP